MSEISWWKESRRRKFRVKIKSLAEEARIIRAEEKRLKSQEIWAAEVRGCLQSHRIYVVRAEQRATLLAYAYWRKKPYRMAESKTSKPIPVKRIQEILKSLCLDHNPKIEEWLAVDLVSK